MPEHNLDFGRVFWATRNRHNAVFGQDFAVLRHVAKCVTHFAGLACFRDKDLQTSDAVQEFKGEVEWGETGHDVPFFFQVLDGGLCFVNGAKSAHHVVDSTREGALNEGFHLLPGHCPSCVDRRGGGANGADLGEQFTSTLFGRCLADTNAFLELFVGLDVDASEGVAGRKDVVHGVERSRHGEAGHLDHWEHGVTSGFVDGVEQHVNGRVGAAGGRGGQGFCSLRTFGANLVGLGFCLGAGRVDGGAGLAGGTFGGLGNGFRGGAACVANGLARLFLRRGEEGVGLGLGGLDAAKDRFHAHGVHLILSRSVGVRFMSMMHPPVGAFNPGLEVERR